MALDRGSPEQEATGRRRSLRELLEILSAPCLASRQLFRLQSL